MWLPLFRRNVLPVLSGQEGCTLSSRVYNWRGNALLQGAWDPENQTQLFPFLAKNVLCRQKWLSAKKSLYGCAKTNELLQVLGHDNRLLRHTEISPVVCQEPNTWFEAAQCTVLCNLYLIPRKAIIVNQVLYILFYSILFYSILFYSILFYSILFYSILFYVRSKPVRVHVNQSKRGKIITWQYQLLTSMECSVNNKKYCQFYGLIFTASNTSAISSVVGKFIVYIACKKQGIRTKTNIFRILLQ